MFGLEEWVYTSDYTQEKILRHFEIATLKGFGIDHLQTAQIAAGAILHYGSNQAGWPQTHQDDQQIAI